MRVVTVQAEIVWHVTSITLLQWKLQLKHGSVGCTAGPTCATMEATIEAR